MTIPPLDLVECYGEMAHSELYDQLEAIEDEVSANQRERREIDAQYEVLQAHRRSILHHLGIVSLRPSFIAD